MVLGYFIFRFKSFEGFKLFSVPISATPRVPRYINLVIK